MDVLAEKSLVEDFEDSKDDIFPLHWEPSRYGNALSIRLAMLPVWQFASLPAYICQWFR
jgi:hypothetical protein